MTTTKWLSYEFHICQHDSQWKDLAGVYIFAAVNAKNQWYPIYIGQAESLAARLPTHERWQEAVRLGATHIHARVVPQKAERDKLEQDLIQAFQPKLNSQLKK